MGVTCLAHHVEIRNVEGGTDWTLIDVHRIKMRAKNLPLASPLDELRNKDTGFVMD